MPTLDTSRPCANPLCRHQNSTNQQQKPKMTNEQKTLADIPPCRYCGAHNWRYEDATKDFPQHIVKCDGCHILINCSTQKECIDALCVRVPVNSATPMPPTGKLRRGAEKRPQVAAGVALYIANNEGLSMQACANIAGCSRNSIILHMRKLREEQSLKNKAPKQ